MKVIRYHSDHGARTGILISTGRKFHKVLLVDNPVRVTKVPLSEERHFTDLEYRQVGRPYPVARAKRILRDAVRRWHGSLREVSKEVREVLS